MKKQELSLTPIKKDETPSSHSSILTRRDETSFMESPAGDLKATQTSTKEQEKLPFGSTTTPKDAVPKAAKSDESYEITEPNTVRSILARAKEVLKTLDSDTSGENELQKRAGIARNSKRETASIGDDKFANETATAVQQVAKLAQSLVSTAATKAIKGKSKSKIQQAAAAAIQKPKPGAQKHGLRATGPGTAGIGNTP